MPEVDDSRPVVCKTTALGIPGATPGSGTWQHGHTYAHHVNVTTTPTAQGIVIARKMDTKRGSIRTKTKNDLKKERRPYRHGCWDHVICAMPWPMHGANIGTLLRTCEALGACLYVPHYPWVPQALSKGYTIKQRACVHWIRPNPLGWLEAQSSLPDTRIIAVELADSATRLADLKPATQRTIMVLGHEQTGIPGEAVDFLDDCVEIPMIGSGTTLNVAVAGSLVLYKLAGMI